VGSVVRQSLATQVLRKTWPSISGHRLVGSG
jgi:hypothetical protein